MLAIYILCIEYFYIYMMNDFVIEYHILESLILQVLEALNGMPYIFDKSERHHTKYLVTSLQNISIVV